MRHTLLGAAAMALLALPSTGNAAATIDFEQFVTGQNIAEGGPFPITGLGVNFSVTVTDPANGSALIFDTAAEGTADPDLEDPFTRVDPTLSVGSPDRVLERGLSLGNVLIIGNANEDLNDLAGGGTLEFVFDAVVELLSFDLIDTGDSGATGVDLTIDDDNPDTEAVTFLNLGEFLQDNEFATIAIDPTLIGLDSVARFSLSGSGAIDNLTFTENPEGADIPEPATLALIGAGLAGIGVARRRRTAA